MSDSSPILSVALTTNEWNAVLNAVAQMPYHMAAPLIAKIQQQAQSQMPVPQPQADHINGSASH